MKRPDPKTLEDLLGETLVWGIPGTKVTPADIRLFRETRAAGLILYRINFESPAQLRKLIRDLEEGVGRRLLVMADHEGGRVVMFRDGVTVFPDNLAFGRSGRAADARKQGAIESAELRRLGVDVNLSPSVDVLTKEYSPNIGIRAYGRDPDVVAEIASARMRAMQAGGVSACAKHFPGKGHSPLDAHLSLPTIPSTWAEMRRVHIKPFLAAMEAGVDIIMSSHPLYPKLDPTPRTPATFSRRIMHDYLRKELGFQGVVSSDDLEMGAIGELCSIGEAAVRTAKAGHDLFLACHVEKLQRQVHAALLEAVRSGEWPVRNLEASVRRIRALRGWKNPRFASGAAKPEPGGKALALSVARRAVSVKDPKKLLPVRGKCAVVFPRLWDFNPKIMIEREMERPERFLEPFLRRTECSALLTAGVDATEAEIDGAVDAARLADTTVLFLFDAHLHKGGKKLLDALQAATKKLVLVLLRDPYDDVYARKTDAVVTAWGFRVCQLTACLEKVFGRPR